MPQPLSVLIVEDNPQDAELFLLELRRAGFDPIWERVDDEPTYLQRLRPELDVILSDHEMPQFNGSRALELLNDRGLDVPFIIVSGTIGEELAVETIKRGAADYLLKDRLIRLGPAVRQAMEKRRIRQEREKAREELRESDERFRQVVVNIGEVFWMTDLREKRVLYISPAYEKIWGLSCQSLYEHPLAWLEAIHPDDRERVRAALPRRVLGTFDEHYRIVCPDGTIRNIRDRAFPVRDASGEVYRLAGLAQDVTEQKHTEQRLAHQAAMLDLAHDAIIISDFFHEQILFWNKGAERMYGWPAEEAIEEPIGELLRMDRRTPAVVVQKLGETGEWHGEAQHVDKSGKKLTVSSRATLVRDDAGRPAAVLWIHTDVTEQRKLEAQFLRAQRMDSIGTLASGVAHDLNNILAPIMMSVPLLRSHLSPEGREGIISTIEMSAERGARIVKQVLAFGRGLEGERKPVSPASSISEMEKIIRETFPKNLRLEIDVDPQLWLVLGDTTQIHQVLINLCVNARDAMPNGGKLRLTARNVEVDANYAAMLSDISAGRYVVLSVADEGTGIPPEILSRIFDPFFTTKGIGQGTGLGLPTVLGIVKSHGGTIQVSTEPQKGSIFQVYLPAAADGLLTGSRQSLEEIPLGNGELILIADDEATIRGATQTVLETHGYEVLCAADGTEALALFAKNITRTAAVVTDLMMPFMDGIALIRALRRMRPDLPIAASTGLGEKTQFAELKSAGITALLQKPYGADALLRMVHELLRSPSPTLN